MQLYWRSHNNGGDFVRVWRDGWAGDMFEIMTRDNLNQFVEIGKPFGIRAQEWADD